MSRGFVIMAQNTDTVDYVACAKVLSDSIKQVMPNANVTIITERDLPYGDVSTNKKWKLANDWQVYDASPYDETIKLEADMFIPKSIEHWWDVLSSRDVVVCSNIRNYRGELSDIRLYRKFIDDNKLPDAYNAITYFKKSDTAARFFAIVRDVFENWNDYKATLKCNVKEEATTDWAYAIACHIIGKEQTMMPVFTDMSMVHMKQYVNYIPTDDWTDTLLYECLPNQIRINTVPQLYPLHYHKKSFCAKIRSAFK